MQDEQRATIPLDEIDVIRFERLALQHRIIQLEQHILQQQVAALEVERERLWQQVREQYDAEGYQLDVVGRQLVRQEQA